MKAGFIGLGIMGRPMAKNLLKAGVELLVTDLNKEAVADVVAAGAKAASYAQIGEECSTVFIIVPNGDITKSILFDEGGVASTIKEGSIVCDMSSVTPVESKECYERLKKQGVGFVDAPVSGGEPGAVAGTLAIMAGGEEKDFEALKPYFDILGSSALLIGEAGSGSVTKLANQIAVAGVMFSVCESLLYAQEAGLDVDKWLELVVPGAGGSTAMNTLGRRILKGDFAPGFFVEHFVKDLGLCLEECRRMGLVLPGTERAEECYRMVQALGGGKDGTQSLVRTLAQACGKQWKR